MRFQLAISVLVILGLLSCLRPMRERAEQDREVGLAILGAWTVEVVDGLAAVRSFDEEGLWLWASAPSFEVHVQPGGIAEDVAEDVAEHVEEQGWDLRIHNVMPGAELQVLDGDVEVSDEEWSLPTRVRWRLRFPTGDADAAVRLAIVPPQAATEGPYRIGVLSDIQEAVVRVQDVFERINQEPDLDFLFGAGDLTERGSGSELQRFQREMETLTIPYYTTLGNHELIDSYAPWHEYFGRGNFHFVYRGVHFTLIDSGSAAVDPIVYAWLARWLEQGRDALHILATHVPPVDPIGVRNGSFASRNEAAKFLALLAEGGIDLTIYGHIHSYHRFRNAGIEAHISGGGGAIPQKFDGLGRHFLVVELDPDAQTTSTRVVHVDRR